MTRKLAGLQMQLAGQMSLYASRQQKDFDRGFAGQAIADLAESARQLPEYFRPHSTAAAVRERLGWSYQRSGNRAQAATEFAQAVRGYDDAIQALSAALGADPAQREAALERVRVRRAKCRLLSGDRAHFLIAQRELAELTRITGSTALDLYNAACLFAVAMACTGLPSPDRSRYMRQAWQLLGRALLADGTSGPWAFVLTDPELEAMDAQQRSRFSTEIKIRHPELTPIGGVTARQVAEEAMQAIGVDPLSGDGDGEAGVPGTRLAPPAFPET
jgi:tetratricopeptide (TPR) repeat protein